ncbi:MAG: hypothetical protein JSR17_11445 [Proteobacteria bacterium]|nr:hypothetical protein [Pseudomonadota bacterium]
MKLYYHIPSSDMHVFADDKTELKLTNEDMLNNLDYTPDTAKKKDGYVIVDDYELIKKFALDEQEEHPLEAFPIYTLTVAEGTKLEEIKVNEQCEEDKDGKYTAFIVPASAVTFQKASLKHVSEKFADFILNKDAELNNDDAAKPADGTDAKPAATAAKFNLLAALRRLAPVGVVASVGFGFQASGALPGFVSWIGSTLGVALPTVGAAGIAVQVAAAGAVGAVAYGAFLAAWTVGKAVVNAVKTAVANRNKTAKQKYEDDKAAAAKDVADMEKALGYDEQNAIVTKFAALVTKAPDASFEGDNLAADQPKGLNQLQVLQQEKDKLSAIKAANDAKDDAKRQDLESKITSRGFRLTGKSS